MGDGVEDAGGVGGVEASGEVAQCASVDAADRTGQPQHRDLAPGRRSTVQECCRTVPTDGGHRDPRSPVHAMVDGNDALAQEVGAAQPDAVADDQVRGGLLAGDALCPRAQHRRELGRRQGGRVEDGHAVLLRVTGAVVRGEVSGAASRRRSGLSGRSSGSRGLSGRWRGRRGSAQRR